MSDNTPDPMAFQPLDHAAAHERLADLGLEADGLDRLESSALPEDQALLGHLRGCSTCQAEVAATTHVRLALRRAFEAMPDAPSLDPISPPANLRASVLAAARRQPNRQGDVVSGGLGRAAATPASPRNPAPLGDTMLARRPRLARLADWPGARTPRWPAAIAATLVVALVTGVIGLQLGQRAAADDIASITQLVATVDRVLAADPHWVAPLTTATGAPAGSVSWSRQDFAVLTTALTPPARGSVYRCWLNLDGRWAVIGEMEFSGTTAYWTGSVGEWATLNVGPDTHFVVTLDAVGSPTSDDGPTTAPVLQANLIE